MVSEFERLFPGHISLLVPDVVIHELNKLLDSQKSNKPIVKLALDFIDRQCEKKTVNNIREEKVHQIDDLILNLAQNLDAIIATNDRDLRKRSRKLGISTVYLRTHAYLEMDGY